MKCKFCGEKITKTNRHSFCSDECSRKYRHMQRKHIYCVLCGKPLTNQYKFCSEECKNKARATRVQKERESCKKPKEEVKEAPKKKGAKQKKIPPISVINEMARAEGLTYGQYVAKHHLY